MGKIIHCEKRKDDPQWVKTAFDYLGRNEKDNCIYELLSKTDEELDPNNENKSWELSSQDGDIPEDIPLWCGVFVAGIFLKSGWRKENFNFKFHWSLGWKKFGSKVETPHRGDVVILESKKRPDGGHVGFFLYKANENNKEKVYILGGNQDEDARKNAKVSCAWYILDGADFKSNVVYRRPNMHKINTRKNFR